MSRIQFPPNFYQLRSAQVRFVKMGRILAGSGRYSNRSGAVLAILAGQKMSASSQLGRVLSRGFSYNLWLDNSIPSLVYEDGVARVVGFFGIVLWPNSVNGKTIRAAETFRELLRLPFMRIVFT